MPWLDANFSKEWRGTPGRLWLDIIIVPPPEGQPSHSGLGEGTLPLPWGAFVDFSLPSMLYTDC